MKRDPIALLREAMALQGRGALDDAEKLYRQALKLAPREANAHNLLGALARQRGDAAGALQHTARALELRPETPAFLANHGAALAEAGRLREAVEALAAAAAARPGDAVTLRNLGQAYCALGEPGNAIAPLTQATRAQPHASEPWLALAHARRELGETAAAIGAAEAALARAGAQPELAEQARFLLAALGAAPPPAAAPAHYVRDLFDQYAPRFAAELTGKLEYRTPEVLAGLLRSAGVLATQSLLVLDLGCGTGLSGLALKPFARKLEGLDLSPRMLAEARRLGIYDALHEAELVAFLPTRPGGFGLIAAADVLNYLGDLAPALAGIHGALAPGGIAAFSVEVGEGAPFALGEGMRYRHDPDRVAALARAAGFTELAREQTTLRRERGVPVAGALFLLRRG